MIVNIMEKQRGEGYLILRLSEAVSGLSKINIGYSLIF